MVGVLAYAAVSERNPSKDKPTGSDLVLRLEHTYAWLRFARERRGLSLRELASLTGVAHSEIQKIETGQQECRLSSFVRICAALDIPAGWVLDLMVQSNGATFARRIDDDPGFAVLMEALQIREESARKVINGLLVSACILASILLRVSSPCRRATFQNYPTEAWRECFLRFAERLENLNAGLERAKTIRALRERPVATLKHLGLLSWDSLVLKRNDLSPAVTERQVGSFGSELYSISFKEAEILLGLGVFGENNDLTDSETSHSLTGVKAQLPSLLERLKKATAETGKKSELARFLAQATKAKVPLASVSRWLSGEREPGGEVALLMDVWATNQGYPRAK